MSNISPTSNQCLEHHYDSPTNISLTILQNSIQLMQLPSIKISLCKNNKDKRPAVKELNWEELQTLLTTFNKAIISKDNAPAFIGGYFDGNGRKDKNLLSRTLITLDIDNSNGSISDLEAFIDSILNKYRYVAYSTSRHSESKARIRIVLFPNKEIKPKDYKNIVTNFIHKYSLNEIVDIKSSTTATQLMYLPIRTSKEYVPWKKVNSGLEVDIDSFMEADVSNNVLIPDNDNNLKLTMLKHPYNLTDKEVTDYLKRYDVSTSDYPTWRDVGFALHHQYSGADKGRGLFVNWSLADTRAEYKDKEDVRKNAERQYSSGDNTRNKSITFATVIYKVNELENEALQKAITKQINALSKLSSEKDVGKIINTLAKHYSENEAECYLQQIKDKTRWQLLNLRRKLKTAKYKVQLDKINAAESFSHYPLHKALPRAMFVEDIESDKPPKGTYNNFMILLGNYNIKIRYNVISKNCDIIVPEQMYSEDNKDNASFADILSVCKLNDMETRHIDSYITKIADQNPYNPILEFIESKPWDGMSRLSDLYNTIETKTVFPIETKELLLRKWLISGVAATQNERFHSKGVLVFQGDQSLGKTAWFKKLLPYEIERYFKEGCTLDPSNKDSVKTAISHWIVELGELDSTFRKDIARLKAFITNNEDMLRLPYARKDSKFSRRTIFCGSVNEEEFLIDSTGNHRFWVIPVVKLDYNHGIDIQQLWTEVDTIYKSGEQWWLTPEEEQKLEIQNQTHFKTSPLEELLLKRFDLNSYSDEWTATDVLSHLDYSGINRTLRNEMVQVLTKLGVTRLSHNKKFLLSPKRDTKHF